MSGILKRKNGNGVHFLCPESGRTAGYTLLEMAVVLIVAGLIMASFFPIYSIYRSQQAIKTTQDNMALISGAIGDFRAVNGRYPAPASMSAPLGNALFGRENLSAALSVLPAGSCDATQGVCIQSGQRAVTLPDGTTPAPRVRVGAIPFRQLNLLEEQAIDGYGNRIMYAVSENLIAQNTFQINSGTIDVRGTGNVSYSSASADFILYSAGPDSAGAFLANGAQAQPCAAPPNPESLNCPTNAQAIYHVADRSTSGALNGNQFDDFVNYFARGDVSPWAQNTTNPGNIYFVSKIVNSGLGVGIMNDNPSEAIDIGGNARARTDLKVQQFCDYTNGNCTNAAVIGGDLDNGGGLKCPAGQYMVGISMNQPVCVNEVKISCPGSQAMTGVAADGSPICSSRPCPSTSVSVCGASYTLPSGSEGNTRTIAAGANYTKTFQCQGGSWVSTGATGSCTCTTQTQTRVTGCGVGMTGQVQQTRTQTCPAGTWTAWVNVSNTCQCVGATQTQNICPSGGGYSGVHNQTRQFVCDNATGGHFTPWVDSGVNTCQCTAVNKTQSIACPGGLTGTITQTATYDCNTSSWGPWVETSRNCTCDSTRTDTQTVACPDRVDAQGNTYPQIGSLTQQRNLQCPGGTWGSWVTTGSTCVDRPVAVCHWKSNGSGVDVSFSRGKEIGSACPCGTAPGPCYQILGAGAYKNYGACTCE